MKNNLKIRRSLRKSKGQGMTEYLIILVLVAIALITVVNQFGGKVKGIFSKSTTSLQTVEGSINGGG